MINKGFETPILFLIFNRPDTTIQVFESIRKQQPKYLYIAADGPRENKPGEIERCEQTRKLVIANIDWPCEVKTLFRTENLGCGKAVSSAISWFFENVEEGIILEDDCLPNDSFFLYCQNLLKYYRSDERIYVISGNNFQKKKRGDASYYFSAYGHIWGWASWRRAWDNYNYSLKNIDDELFKDKVNQYFKSEAENQFWLKAFQTMKYNPIDTWDYQWSISIWLNDGLNILPNHNLVTNIGFNQEATHTTSFIKGISELKSFKLNKIKHPTIRTINREADQYTYRVIYNPETKLYSKIRNKIKREILKFLKIF